MVLVTYPTIKIIKTVVYVANLCAKNLLKKFRYHELTCAKIDEKKNV